MKYWVFTRHQVRGPFSTEQLLREDGLTASTLVCSDSDHGEWKRLSAVPALSALMPVSALPESLIAPASLDFGDALWRKLDERVAALEASVERIQEELRAQALEMARARRDLAVLDKPLNAPPALPKPAPELQVKPPVPAPPPAAVLVEPSPARARPKTYGGLLVRLFLTGMRFGGTVFGGLHGAYFMHRDELLALKWGTEQDAEYLYGLSFFLPGIPYLVFFGVFSARLAGLAGAFLANLGVLLPSLALVLILPLIGRIPIIAANSDAMGQGAIWGATGLLFAIGFEGFKKLKTNVNRVIFLTTTTLLCLKVSILTIVFGGAIFGALFLVPKQEVKAK